MLYINVTLRLSYIAVRSYDNLPTSHTYVLQHSFY